MFSCAICPFHCGVDRRKTLGVCGLPNDFLYSHSGPHFWEEPMVSGENGSGTIFFTGCNGRCVFCQNYEISAPEYWKKNVRILKPADLFQICLDLVEKNRVHNINLVSPTPYSHLLRDFLKEYKEKIGVPIIWNSNGYEKAATIRDLAGLIDVYLPDLKYFAETAAVRYSRLPNYFEYASAAIQEMWRQVSDPQLNTRGLIEKGVIIRHLVLPGLIEDSKKVLDWIRNELGTKTYVSLMAQYYPTYQAEKYPEINRVLTREEYQEIMNYFLDLGFSDGLIQDLSAADARYTPNWGEKNEMA